MHITRLCSHGYQMMHVIYNEATCIFPQKKYTSFVVMQLKSRRNESFKWVPINDNYRSNQQNCQIHKWIAATFKRSSLISLVRPSHILFIAVPNSFRKIKRDPVDWSNHFIQFMKSLEFCGYITYAIIIIK